MPRFSSCWSEGYKNAVVLVGFILWPQEYSVMFPKEIKKAAAHYVNGGLIGENTERFIEEVAAAHGLEGDSL